MNRDETVVALNKIADELEAHPERWAQGGYAFNAKGIPVGILDEEAVRWCTAGLCYRYEGSSRPPSQSALITSIHRSLPGPYAGIPFYNDHSNTTVEDVIKLFRRAAASI